MKIPTPDSVTLQAILKPMRKFIFMILIATLNSCGTTTGTYSDNFYVIWNHGGNDSFDLKNMKFQRKYVERDTIIDLNLTSEHLRNIYDILVRNKITELESEDFSNKCPSYMIPSFTDRLVINYANKKSLFVWGGSYIDCKDEESRWNTFNLNKALSEINAVIDNLPEVSELEQSDIIYL
jgi:hypothetical protein